MNELETKEQSSIVDAFDFTEIGEKAEEAQELDNEFCENSLEAVERAKKALRAFKRLHDLTANHYQGTWRKWLAFRNITKDDAARMLRKYDYVVANGDNADYILQLSESRGGKRLVDEAARPSTPQELKDKVASGDVTTLPEFKKLKAELEATKNVLRTTESKLDGMEHQVNMNIEAKEQAEQWRDEAINDCNAAKEALMGAEDERDQAIKERDEAKADADQLREKANAYDDLQQMNHTLREKLREKDEELLNRPERETIITKEVVPKDYNDIKEGNAILRRQVAELRAHAQGMSLQEYAQKDEKHREFVKTVDEEYASAKRIRNVLSTLVQIQMHEAEIREDGRCFLKVSSDRDETLADAQDTVRKAKRGIEVLEEVFFTSSPLKVVK